ncbi:MAG TPA: ABC transporter permease subunit [Tepidisphaeraceae bacterium]|nr:ABC transporter permease subunit [Tepidisphaeraceae bacterium]
MPIFDQGYQHWSGELSGHAWRWLAISRQGVRVGLKNRFLRLLLFVAWVPALALVLMLCAWGLLERGSAMVSGFTRLIALMQPSLVMDPKYYRADIWRLSYGYFLQIELWVSMILVLLAGPSLISQDLRFNALPLYFSRPLRRIDYFLGKLGVIVAFLAMVVILPAIVAYIFGLLFSLDITILRDTFGILLASIGYGVIIALSAGLLILALSTLSRNSRYVALLWIGLWFVGSIVGHALQAVDSQDRRQAYYNKITVTRPMGRDDASLSNAERQRQRREWHRAIQRANDEYRVAELEFSKNDWRPLVSYSANLSRLGQQLLHTNQTWAKLAAMQPDPASRDRILALYMGPQFPWYWSAGVLVGLFGLSACILNFSVKSLDKLK